MGIWDDIFGGGQPAIRGTEVDPRTVSEAMWAEMREAERTDPGLNPYYTKYKQYDPELRRQQQAEQDAAFKAQLQSQLATAQQSSPTTAAPIVDPATAEAATRTDALARLEALMPAGFEQTLLPATFDDPFIEQALSRERGKAGESLERGLVRGTVTESGKAKGLQALETQTPGARTTLSDIGNLLLEQERGSLREIAGGARTTAGGLAADQPFDPGTYFGQAQQRVADFTSGFAPRFEGSVPRGLYDVSGAVDVAGAVQGPQNISFDPYAVAGEKLETGLEGEPAPAKKRTTAVF